MTEKINKPETQDENMETPVNEENTETSEPIQEDEVTELKQEIGELKKNICVCILNLTIIKSAPPKKELSCLRQPVRTL